MLNLPDFDQMYEFENNYMLTTKPHRIGKLIAQFELFKKTCLIPGDIVEFGVFKGASFSRIALYRKLLGLENSKKLIGFDIFGKFPEAQTQSDLLQKQSFTDAAGEESISQEQLESVLDNNGCRHNTALVGGDICESLPEYLNQNPATKFSLINLDVDLENVTEIILENTYERLSKGGIIMFDDYGFFAGATRVIDSFCEKQHLKLCILPFAKTPTYVIKE